MSKAKWSPLDQFGKQAGVIFLTIFTMFLVVTPIVAWFQGPEAWLAAAKAAATCFLGSISGLLAGRIADHLFGSDIGIILIPMFFRMGIPLIVAVGITLLEFSTSYQTLVLCFLVGFYLMVLPVDILLQLPFGPKQPPKSPPVRRSNPEDRPEDE
jgi:hypothetical protein